jgi:hypothetical protein
MSALFRTDMLNSQHKSEQERPDLLLLVKNVRLREEVSIV